MRKLYIQPYNQDEFDLKNRLPSVEFLNLTSQAPQINGDWLTVAGSDGQQLNTLTYGATTVTLSLLIRAETMSAFRIAKNELQRIFYQRQFIRLRSTLEPGRCYWVVANPVDITPAEGSSWGAVNLTFTNPSGMAQSIVRSDELPAEASQLAYGMNLPAKDLSYVGKNERFNIYNPSDVAIDPYIQHHDLIITVTGVGSSFTLTNATNNTSIKVNSSLASGQTFKLDGVIPSINGNTQVDTDFGNIKLEQGDNDIRLSGLSNAKVTFSFPFLYF